MPPLLSLVLRRSAYALLTLVAVSVLIFIGTEILPGDLAQVILGQTATPETVAALRRELGLDRPAPQRYVEWILGAFNGDFGVSLANRVPVAELVGDRLGKTLVLAATAAAISVPLSLILGIVAALHRERPTDHAISAVTLAFVSFPEFLIGYALVIVFAINLGWLPALSTVREGADLTQWLRAIALPATTLSLVLLAHTMRLTRTAIVNVLSADYVQMAELKGLSPARVIVRHAFPNAIGPILSIVMLTFAYLVVGVVVVEVVFNYSGMGKLMVDAVSNRDMPLVQACGLIFSAIYIVCNLLADLLGIVANPRLLHPK
ncbi:MAG: ABC transporter permease [Alphaproteobacteria bacterium]|nr:ABC transporter permease [Alphaproteobacteria bacterium]